MLLLLQLLFLQVLLLLLLLLALLLMFCLVCLLMFVASPSLRLIVDQSQSVSNQDGGAHETGALRRRK